MERVLGAQEEEPGLLRILADGVDVRERSARQAGREIGPRFAVVLRPEHVGRRVALLVTVDRHVGGAGGEVRRVDVAHRAEGRQAGEVRGHVGPRLAAVPRQLDLAVVRAGPDQPGLERALGDREHDRRDRRSGVVEGQAAGASHERRVGGGQIGRDPLPALASVAAPVDILAAGVDGLRIVRRGGEGRRPLEAVLECRGRRALDGQRPDADIPRLARVQVVELELTVVAAGPDEVRVGAMNHREADLAAADGVPLADRDALGASSVEDAARPSHRGSVLAVAVDEVGPAVVGRDVVHLGDRQLRPVPGASAVVRDADAAVVADDPPVGIERVDPDVVVVPAGLFKALAFDRAAAVERDGLPGGDERDLVRAVGRRGHPRVVERPCDQVQVAADQPP